MKSDENPGCADCGQPLSTSVYLVRGSIYKSCALCSRVAGQHVYHRIIEFGMWHTNTDEKRPYPQSECIRAYRARVAAVETLTGKTNEQLASLLPSLPAIGRRCAKRNGETPLLPGDPLVAEALEPLRQEAEAELAAAHPVGRQFKKTRVVRPEQVAIARFAEASSTRDEPPAPKPTVLRRRRTGETVSAEAV